MCGNDRWETYSIHVIKLVASGSFSFSCCLSWQQNSPTTAVWTHSVLSICAHSSFGQLLQENRMTLPNNSPFPGTSGPALLYVFVRDEAFTLDEHFLGPFSSCSFTTERMAFNYCLTRARRVLKCSFGILANKWRFLHTPIHLIMQHAINAVKAACTLHILIGNVMALILKTYLAILACQWLN